MGAKYSPCMRRDGNVENVLQQRKAVESGTACCIHDDGSGCFQSEQNKCNVSHMLITSPSFNHTVDRNVQTMTRLPKLAAGTFHQNLNEMKLRELKHHALSSLLGVLTFTYDDQHFYICCHQLHVPGTCLLRCRHFTVNHVDFALC